MKTVAFTFGLLLAMAPAEPSHAQQGIDPVTPWPAAGCPPRCASAPSDPTLSVAIADNARSILESASAAVAAGHWEDAAARLDDAEKLLAGQTRGSEPSQVSMIMFARSAIASAKEAIAAKNGIEAQAQIERAVNFTMMDTRA